MFFLRDQLSAGASYNLDYSRARAYCACRGAGGGCLDILSLFYLLLFWV